MKYIDYRDDPRSVLIHIGNENSGRYKRGTGDRPFQHIANIASKRKYQNPDGSLTERGIARFEAEKRRNALKKKENRVKDEDDLKDPDLWVKQDVENTKSVVDATGNFVKELRKANEPNFRDKTFNLSNTTDDELRKRINRLQMEEQYTRLMNANNRTVSKGRMYIDDILKYAGSTLTLTSSALAIALAIKNLKGP